MSATWTPETIAGRRALLEAQSEAVDDHIERRLLKDLVLRYAATERRLQELNHLKNKFLGMAAHDLRSPLGSVRGLSELMRDGGMGPLTDAQREVVGLIAHTARQMLTLVNDLLDVATIESGRLDIQACRQPLAPLVEERIRIARLAADAKDIRITWSAEAAPEVVFDSARLGQVLDNLLSNAIKFSPRETTVRVRVFQTADRACVSVADQGPGLSAEDRTKLFGEFQKLSARPTGGEKSTGLGLAIAKKIVQAHASTLEVDSPPGEGAVFTVALPLARG